MLHLFDDIGRPIKVSLLLSRLASTREINEVCEESQVVLKRPTAVAESFTGSHVHPVAPLLEQSLFDDHGLLSLCPTADS